MGTNSRLTDEGWACYPIWAPDGKRLLFMFAESIGAPLFWQPYDRSSAMKRLTTEYGLYPESWSKDGNIIACAEMHPDTGFDIQMLDIRTGKSTPFLNSKFMEMYPEFSPDGRWLAYMSNETNRGEVYVTDFPGRSKKVMVSSDGGMDPLWARNGNQLFYRRSLDQVWVVDVRTDGGFSVSKPRLLFEYPGYSHGIAIRTYDLSLDSQRFLMVKFDQRKPTPVTEMIHVENWFEELKRLVPTGK